MTMSRWARVRVERVRVEAEAGDDEPALAHLRRRSRRPRPSTGSRRRCGSCRRSAGVGPVACGQQAISRTRSRWPAVQSATSSSGVSGTARSGGRASSGSSGRRAVAGGRRPAATGGDAGAVRSTSTQRRSRGAARDRVVDEHLVVAVGEVGVGRVRRRTPGEDVGVDRPEQRAERVAEALDVAAGQRRRGPAGRSPISAGLRRRISFGRSRWPSQRWSGVSRVPGRRRRRSRRSPTGASSSGRR